MTRGYQFFACGFLTGAALGAAASLLFAPKRGSELRSGIRERVDALRHEATNRYTDVRRRGRNAALRAREALRATSDGMRDAARELRGPGGEDAASGSAED